MSNLAKKILENFSQEDKEVIKSWAESAIVIKNDGSLSQQQKVKKLYELSSKGDVIKRFLKGSFNLIKKEGWDKRSLPARLAILGGSVGVVVGGSQMVGIASAGIGIGMPLFLLTSAGGAFLGVIIKEVQESKK